MARSALLDSHASLVAYLRERYPELFEGRNLNSASWRELHLRALAYAGDADAEREWLEGFASRLTCGTCRADWRAYVAANPPTLTDADTYFKWSWQAHEAVNAKLSKPSPSLADALAHWRSVAAG